MKSINKIENINRNSFEEVDLLNKQADEARKDNNNLSLSVSKEAISLAQLLGYSKGLAKAYLNAGISCRLSSNFEAAIEYYQEALNINRRLKDKKAESRTLNAIANVYYSLSDFEKAIEYYDECIFVLQSIGDMNFEAAVLTNRGLSYQLNGDLRAALNNYLESLSIYKSSNTEIHYALYNNLGIVYLETGSYQESLLYFTKALKETQNSKNVIDESFTLANIGRTYIYMSDFANAITYLSEAMIIMKKYGNRQAETQVFANLAKAYMKMRCFPEAIKYYNRALKYYKEIGDKSSVDHTLCELGELYFELNDYKTSKQFFMDGLEVSQKINDIMNVVRINTGLARLYLKFRDTEKAMGFLNTAEKMAKTAKSYKDLSKICMIYSENYSISGNFKEAKVFLDKHYKYLEKINNLTESNKIQALMLGHIKDTEVKEEPAYYYNLQKDQILSIA